MTYFYILISALLLYSNAAAVEFQPDPGTQDDDIPLVSDEHERTVDDTHEKASEMVVSAADWIDSFFDDDRSILEENTTRVKVRFFFEYSRIDEFDFSADVKLRLELPKLSERASLVISSSDDDDFDEDGNPVEGKPGIEDEEHSDLSASLNYFLKIGEAYHLSSTFGVSSSYVYAGLRYRYEHDFGSWLGRVTDTIRWYTDDGWENKLSMDMERHFSTHWFFRSTAGVNWYEKENGLPHYLAFNLYQVISEYQVLLYEVGNYFDTEPNYRMTDILFRVRYRQRFFRDWLIFEVAPQISFPDEYGREPNPGIVFRLEVDFGYLADHKVFHSVFRF